MRIALAIEYNGAALRGWQSQPCGQTVQDSIEQALGEIAQQKIAVQAAGRTDAGVHAALMPAHFDPPDRLQPSAWVQGANAHLPAAVKILWAAPVATDFHARHSAERRYYQYILLNRPVRPALLAAAAGHCHVALDVGAMRRAARFLRGEHDFSSFRAASCQAKTTVRHLYHLHIQKSGGWIVFNFCGNAFLHHMVRNIVGALVAIGRGRQPPQWMRDLLAAGDRTQCAPTAAAAGLYFSGALYSRRYRLPPCRSAAPLGKGGLALPG